MTYIATIEYYDDYASCCKENKIFIAADTIAKAVETISNFYGEKYLESIKSLEPFSPDNFLIFEEKDFDLFDNVANTLKENVVW